MRSDASGGAQRHHVKLDAPRFLGSALRPTLQLGYTSDRYYPYYGPYGWWRYHDSYEEAETAR